MFKLTVALQEHVDDDLQVDETTGENDQVPVSPVPTVTTTPPPPPAQDSAQIARKIKDIISLKGSSSTRTAAEETVTRSESQSSTASGTGTKFHSLSMPLILSSFILTNAVRPIAFQQHT